jgi:hypothetical protein
MLEIAKECSRQKIHEKYAHMNQASGASNPQDVNDIPFYPID